MTTSIRGRVAVIGIGETNHVRDWVGKTQMGLVADAAYLAIRDAGLRHQDIDGLLSGGSLGPAGLAEYMGLKNVTFATATSAMGASAAVAAMIAAEALECGYCNYVLFVAGGAIDSTVPEGRPGEGLNPASEFHGLYGPAAAANNGYGLCYTRHMYEFGTKPEQLARIVVDQRCNTLNNPRSAFREQGLITVEDVLNSRYVSYPLHLLECAIPVAGAAAYIMTTAERAKTHPKKPVYMLGNGFYEGAWTSWMGHDVSNDITLMATERAARRAYALSGYGPMDMDIVECDDLCTILAAMCVESSHVWGLQRGDIGPFYETTDTTYKGTRPINTDGGQLSAGQLDPTGASGAQQLLEAVRQLRGEAESQVPNANLALSMHCGGDPTHMGSLVWGTEATL